jgi:hypothetical protein
MSPQRLGSPNVATEGMIIDLVDNAHMLENIDDSVDAEKWDLSIFTERGNVKPDIQSRIDLIFPFWKPTFD